MGFSFTSPWLLLGAFSVILLPRKNFWWSRALTITLLIIALAGPHLVKSNNNIIVLVDVSQSVGQQGLAALKQFNLTELNSIKTFVFAGNIAAEDKLPSENVAEVLQLEQTDIAKALQVAKVNKAGRILLISDGAASLGNTLVALPNIPVDTYFVPARKNIRLKLFAPENVTSGEFIDATAIIESDLEASIILHASLGDEKLAPKIIQLKRGRVAVPLNFKAAYENQVTLNAHIQIDPEQAKLEQPTSDDFARANIKINQTESLLVINDSALASVLRAQDFEVIEGKANDITDPLPHGAIILRESAVNFTAGQQRLLQQYVKNGGGLMMTGGPKSFGFGNWYRTPVEEILPVNTDVRTDIVVPLVAMVMVLDRSQSMSIGNVSKLELAKEGALNVVELAYQEDLLGLITFSDKEKWVFHLRKATKRGKQEMAEGILNLSADGGTVLTPAYKAAIDELNNSPAATKHIIILSDGQISDSVGPFGQTVNTDFIAMSNLAAEQGITTSTIAIGQGADFEHLAAIAKSGKGRYHSALDVGTLPRIFASEALTATRALLREGKIPLTIQSHPLISNKIILPATIEAYTASTLKPTSELLISGLEAEPILAISRQGLGRSAAFTSDLNSTSLNNWAMLPTLLGTVVRWLKTRPNEYATKVGYEGNQIRVVLDVIQEGKYVTDEEFAARYNAITTPLEQTAVGRYEALLPANATEKDLLIINGSEIVSQVQIPLANNEFNTKEGKTLLTQIAEKTGGLVLNNPLNYVQQALTQQVSTQQTSIWHWFALLALSIFLIELVGRKFTLDETKYGLCGRIKE